MSRSSNAITVYQTSSSYAPEAMPVYQASPSYAPEAMSVLMTSPSYAPEAMPVCLASPSYTPNARPVFNVGCFPKYELVYKNDNFFVPIGSLSIGDEISSWDIALRKKQYTVVTKIHEYTVHEIIDLNNNIHVSSSHPLMVIDRGVNGIFVPKWKVACDINVGDCIVGPNNKYIIVNSKDILWHNNGIRVLNLSTDGGIPFFVKNCLVRAENSQDDIKWTKTSVTQKLVA